MSLNRLNVKEATATFNKSLFGSFDVYKSLIFDHFSRQIVKALLSFCSVYHERVHIFFTSISNYFLAKYFALVGLKKTDSICKEMLSDNGI